ncbi:MAG: phosphatase PAP2 family protein [Clostridia bacterium]|nr:phosphatase PAP2 family protein [Clostridia bacterium]
MDTLILQFFESIRCSFLTVVFSAFTLLGEAVPLIAAVCLLYWLLDKKLAERLMLTTFTSVTLNAYLKVLVSRPRPFTVEGGVSRVEIDNPLVSTMSLEPTQSFPSGHSQLASGLFFTGAFHFRKKWAWILFPLLTLGVMCSRLYLGVHYPSDVLVGATLGIAFAWIWDYIYNKHEKKKFIIAGIFAAVFVILCLISPSKTLAKNVACLCGVVIGVPLENKYIKFENHKDTKKNWARAGIGLLCVGAEYLLFSALPFSSPLASFIKYFLLVIVAGLFVPYLFKKLKI